ncbi:SGNH/GDSL hydrolase family protein [Pseudonocardia spinosispora]|uniref:SGNH/GDSL hydrolase family protein n=1 Tax=Pseudonocardia spinosispora TaxID=103441 RepID=UPI00048C8C1A|nr:SGNH/GDSL hydrolase family protein [Pseudonocardia spinosispora]
MRHAGSAMVVAATCVGLAALTPGVSFADTGPEISGRYVSLGDSYVAGPLIPLQTGTPSGCLRSDHNYPSLVRTGVHSSQFQDVSCSGATTKEMTSPQAVTGGSNPPQLTAVTKDTGLVTLGIGGNDIGFADIIKNCAVKSPSKPLGAACKDYYNQGGRDQLAERIEATAPKVAAVLDQITKRAPDAKVLVVGYPTILPAKGPGCFPVVPFSPGDVAWLREVQGQLNDMLADEADRTDAEFVDTARSSVGHDVCQLPGTKWVEGLVPTSPAAPVHPNALGMRNSANDVLAALHTRVLAP